MESLPALIDEDPNFTPEEKEKIKIFEESGLPGVSKLDDSNSKLALKMYLEGCSFDLISNKFRIKKDVLLYRAYKENWGLAKKKHLIDLSEGLFVRIDTARLSAASFVADFINFNHEYYQKKMDDYRRTKDDRIVESMDLKLFDKYYKALEIAEKMVRPDPKDPKAPALHFTQLNIGANSGKKGADAIEAVANQIDDKKTSDILKSLADAEREKDKE